MAQGVTWVPKDAPKPLDRDYFVPNFGKDHDVVDSAASLAATEAKLGRKLVIPKSTRPKGDKVPKAQVEFMSNPKLDAEVVTTLKNEKSASESLGQKWTIEWEK